MSYALVVWSPRTCCGGDFFGTKRSEWDAQSLRERPWSLEAAVRAFKEANACFEASRT